MPRDNDDSYTAAKTSAIKSSRAIRIAPPEQQEIEIKQQHNVTNATHDRARPSCAPADNVNV